MTKMPTTPYTETYRYRSKEVATYIVAWANEHKVSINLTKTQKLLYVAYGANLVLGHNRLCNEHPQAWPYGPVFPSTRTMLLHMDLDNISFADASLAELVGDEYLEWLIEFVFKGFGMYTASQLTDWSHSPKSPWESATRMPGFKWGMEIPDVYIYEYFRTIITNDGK